MNDADLRNTVVVVGAGRSGTTMMREALSAHPDLVATDFEMNYLWRYGNARLPHDMLDPEQHFSQSKARYIRRALAKLLKESGKPRLVEKTVANVMRLRYVHAVLPDAKFIHIIRDGRAVTASAMERWQAKPRLGYLASKGRTVPARDLPVTAFRFVQKRIWGHLRGRGYSQSWGPRWPGFDRDVEVLSLATCCAKQWVISVATARAQARELPADNYLEVRYESIVADPVQTFLKIAKFIEVDPENSAFRAYIDTQIRANRVDLWMNKFSDEELSQVKEQAGLLLSQLGYS